MAMDYYVAGIAHTTEIQFIPGPDSDSFVMMYYSPVPGEETRGWEKQHFFSVNAGSGYGSYLGAHALLEQDNEQLHVQAIGALQVYTYRSSPYPQIGLYRRSGCAA